MQPKRIFSYKKKWRGKLFRVVGPLFASGFRYKCFVRGTVLRLTGEWGYLRGRRCLRVIWRRKTKRSLVEFSDWVDRSDLLNPNLVRETSAEEICRKNTAEVLGNIERMVAFRNFNL